MLLAEFSMVQMIPVVALAMLSFLLLKRSSRYFVRPEPKLRSQTPLQRGPAPASPKEYERWQVEMHDLSRELKAEIDCKIILLEQLIREANEAATRLEAARRDAAEVSSPERNADSIAGTP